MVYTCLLTCKSLSLLCISKLEQQNKKEQDGLSICKNWVQAVNIVRKTTDNHQRPPGRPQSNVVKQMCMCQEHLHILTNYRKYYEYVDYFY